MNKHLTANHRQPILHIQAVLTELAPTINAFKSESVQLALIDGFVLPTLLVAAVQMQIEASLEFYLGHAAKLQKGDIKKDLDSLQLSLDALKAQKALVHVLIARIDPKAVCHSDEQQIVINRMIEQVERQMAEIRAGEAGRDRQKAVLDSFQKLLDTLRSVKPQI